MFVSIFASLENVKFFFNPQRSIFLRGTKKLIMAETELTYEIFNIGFKYSIKLHSSFSNSHVLRQGENLFTICYTFTLGIL